MQTLFEVCLRHNLIPPLEPWPGAEYRIDDPEKTGQGDGYLYLFADGAGGFIQNHRNHDRGETFFFAGRGTGQKLSEEQKRELRKMRERAKEARAYEQRVAADLAVSIWNRAQPAPVDHPWLVRKGVQSLAPMLRCLWQIPVDAPRVLHHLQLPVLLAPIIDVNGRPMTIEYIDAVGAKRYHTDGEREAGLAVVMRGEWEAGPVYLAEGLSTSCSVADATGRPCVAAFDAGNLPKVAAALRARYPAMQLVIAADDDITLERAQKGNKGVLKAQEAAIAGAARAWIIPDFTKLRDRGEWSDFNDMAALLGLEAVRDRLDLSSMPTEACPPWLNDPLQEIRGYGFGEAELASAFARLRPDLKYVDAWGTWLSYAGGVWKREKTLFAFDLVGELCQEVIRRNQVTPAQASTLRKATTRKGIETIAKADRRLAGVTDQWDRHDWLLNTPAGVIDLKSGTIVDHRPDLYLTHQTSVAPEGDCPTFQQFLFDVCKGDTALVDYHQRLAGYCLTGLTYEQVLLFFYGGGRNGKGTLLDTYKFIMSGYYTAAASETFTASHNDRHKSELAVLMGSRLVTSSEIEQGKSWNDKRIKELTGQDTITANFMRCDPFTFVPNFKLIISSNNKPRFNNVDPAIRARMQLVPFLQDFEALGTKDPHMRAKLQAEAGGVLSWMVEGCSAWQRHGLQPPAIVKDATKEYLDSEDLEALWLEDCCVREWNREELLSTLFTSWVGYAETRHGRTKRDRDLADRLEREGFSKRKTMNGVAIQGLRLKTTSERPSTNIVPFSRM
jgi:P4 family phage/plasmid primase-like protien